MPNASYLITTPSRFGLVASSSGNVANPSNTESNFTIYIFKYCVGSQLSLPPLADDLILSASSSSNAFHETSEVCVLVIPVVGLPFGSLVARQNSIRVSAARLRYGCIPSSVSAFKNLKSLFNTSI